jgi:hypothetical protein
VAVPVENPQEAATMSERTDHAQVRREHEELLHGLQRIQGLLQHEPAGGQVGSWAERLRGELQSMSSRLVSHFEHEEHGLYKTLVAQSSSPVQQMDALLAEHGSFVNDLESIADDNLSPSTTPSYGDVKQRLTGWLQRLRDHERRETDFIARSFVSRHVDGSSD